MIKIDLAKTDKVALIDDESFHLVCNYTWRLDQYGYARYGYRDGGKQKSIRMHQLILGKKDGYEIDHINGDPLDNRKANLRYCTKRQNAMNRHKVVGTSKYKGVCWLSREKRWQAKIVFYGKKIGLGNYKNEEAAALAYNKKAKELFGDFASTNMINI